MTTAQDIQLIDSGVASELPTVLCLHGIGSSSAAFGPQIEGLGDRVRVVAWDAPGYGSSADPAQPLDLDGFAESAAQVIRRLDVGPVHVLGVSWGGVIAVALAARCPELVKSLILASASRGSGQTAEQAAAMRGRAHELAELGATTFAERRAPRLVSGEASAELVRRVAATMASSIRLPGYGYAAASMAATDLSSVLAGIAVPTLVLCGDRDEVTGLPESQALAGGIADAVFVLLANAGHLANQEQPDSFNAWVLSFVEIVEGLRA